MADTLSVNVTTYCYKVTTPECLGSDANFQFLLSTDSFTTNTLLFWGLECSVLYSVSTPLTTIVQKSMHL